MLLLRGRADVRRALPVEQFRKAGAALKHTPGLSKEQRHRNVLPDYRWSRCSENVTGALRSTNLERSVLGTNRPTGSARRSPLLGRERKSAAYVESDAAFAAAICHCAT